jgi:hypothetical protein
MASKKIVAVAANLSVFAQKVLAELNKSDDQKQIDKVNDFVKTADLDLRSSIFQYKHMIEEKTHKKEIETRELDYANADLLKAQFSIHDTTELWIESMGKAEKVIAACNKKIADIDQEVVHLNKQIEKMTALLEGLK